jgi:hypothetical protein
LLTASAEARPSLAGEATATNILDGGPGDDTLSGEIIGEHGSSRLFGGAGDDQLTVIGGHDNLLDGGPDDDTLVSGQGDDTLVGGGGDDTYLFDLGSGLDLISEAGGQDTIRFGAGITEGDVSLRASADGSDLLVGVGNDLITIDQQFTAADHFVENIEFADGTVRPLVDDPNLLSVDDLLATEDADPPSFAVAMGGGDAGPIAEASGVAPAAAGPALAADGGGGPVVNMASLVPAEPEAVQAG